MVPSAVKASVYITLGKFRVFRQRLKGVEPEGRAVSYWLECRWETEAVKPDFIGHEPSPVEFFAPRCHPLPVPIGQADAAGIMPLQERVPYGIKKALVSHGHVDIRAIRKPAGKVVRTETESSLRASDDHNVVFVDTQRF